MKFSASRSPLLALCLYPFRPDVEPPKIESDSDAKIGTVAWARAAAHVEGQPDPGNEGLSPGEAKDCDAYYARMIEWLTDRVRLGWRTEVKFAWSPARDEGRELPPSDKLRDYSDAKDDEVCGSTDLVYFDDDVVCVDDVKTGVTPLTQYIPQIRTLGMMAARATTSRKVRVRLVKFYKDRQPDEWMDDLDGFAIDRIADDLATRLAMAKDAVPIPGSHCTELFCPARLVCPEAPAAVAELVPAEALVKAPKFSAEFISHDHDARQLDFLRLVGKACDDLKKLIKARTPAGGVPLADGRVFKEGFHDETRFREESLIAKVRELAAKAGLPDDDIERELEACRYTFKKSEGLKVVKAKKVAA